MIGLTLLGDFVRAGSGGARILRVGNSGNQNSKQRPAAARRFSQAGLIESGVSANQVNLMSYSPLCEPPLLYLGNWSNIAGEQAGFILHSPYEGLSR